MKVDEGSGKFAAFLVWQIYNNFPLVALPCVCNSEHLTITLLILIGSLCYESVDAEPRFTESSRRFHIIRQHTALTTEFAGLKH
jgi:hypothetical protein